MSGRPIQVGDLVQVVRPSECCGAETTIGITFLVACLEASYSHCFHCKTPFQMQVVALSGDLNPDGNRAAFSLSRLKRIPPLDELESVQTDEKLKVSA